MTQGEKIIYLICICLGSIALWVLSPNVVVPAFMYSGCSSVPVNAGYFAGFLLALLVLVGLILGGLWRRLFVQDKRKWMSRLLYAAVVVAAVWAVSAFLIKPHCAP